MYVCVCEKERKGRKKGEPEGGREGEGMCECKHVPMDYEVI